MPFASTTLLVLDLVAQNHYRWVCFRGGNTAALRSRSYGQHPEKPRQRHLTALHSEGPTQRHRGGGGSTCDATPVPHEATRDPHGPGSVAWVPSRRGPERRQGAKAGQQQQCAALGILFEASS